MYNSFAKAEPERAICFDASPCNAFRWDLDGPAQTIFFPLCILVTILFFSFFFS